MTGSVTSGKRNVVPLEDMLRDTVRTINIDVDEGSRKNFRISNKQQVNSPYNIIDY